MTKTPISTNTVLDFKDFRKYSDTLCESGTARLGGVNNALSAGFLSVLTVEACENYHKENIIDLVKRFGFTEEMGTKDYEFHNSGCFVKLYFGMSQDRMSDMVKVIDKPAVWWLDAHVSGPNSAGHEDYMEKGNDSAYAQDNVITAELKIILAHRKDHIILIDDQNGFTDEVKKYMAMILEANSNYEFFMYDEQRGDERYIDKCLVCIPGGAECK